MGRLITLVLVIGAIAGAAYLFLYKRDEATRTARGYKKAETPQVAADMFKKAIESRSYDMAAFYCTAGYAEQLKRGEKAASKLGESIDDMIYQLNERKLMRDEVKLVFHCLDPFPKDIQIIVGKESGDTCDATIAFGSPNVALDSPTAGDWKMKPEIFQVYVRSLQYSKDAKTVVVKLKKDPQSGEWKFDFPVDATLQLRVGYLNDKYMNYVNPLDKVKLEVKTDASTKENVTSRLKTELEQAAKE